MERYSKDLYHSCGHVVVPIEGSMADESEYAPRSGFFCARCMQSVQRLFHTQIYVNLQQISPGMAAFVLEISDSSPVFAEFLAAIGFVSRQASFSELEPGGVAGLLPVWRKEFWFEVNIQPAHVIALMARIREEACLLAEYLPDGVAAVHFADFPGVGLSSMANAG
jgi:hypothetical protein